MKNNLLLIIFFILIAGTKINAQNKVTAVVATSDASSIQGLTTPADVANGKSKHDAERKPVHSNTNAAPTRIAGAPLSTSTLSGYNREDFEGSFPPAGWQVVDVLDPDTTFVKSNYHPYTGTYSARCYWAPIGVTGEDWLILPKFTVASTDSFSFYFSTQVVNYPDTLYVLVSTTDSNLTSFTTLLDQRWDGYNYPTPSLTYEYLSYSLAAFAGQDIYVAIRNVNIYGDGIFIDRVAIGTKPPDAASVSVDIPKFAAVGTLLPKATFKNDGDSIISFPVTMTISGGYTSTKSISNLAPGNTYQVTFDPYTSSTPGSRVVSIQTNLIGDTFFGNDTLSTAILLMETFTNYGWSQRKPLPVARYGAATGAINNNIASDMYVSGGNKSGSISDSTNHFIPVNNNWAPSNTIPKMPKGAFLASAATVKDKIYIAGGFNPTFTSLNNNQIYDPIANTWANGFNMSSAVGDYAIGVYKDSIIYYMGGYTGSLYRNNVQLFVPSSFTWIPGTQLPVSGAGWRGGIIGNKIVITGGTNSTAGALATTYIGTIDPVNPYLISWVQGTDFPSGPTTRLAGGASLDASSGLVLFTGGDPLGTGAQALDYTFAYDVNVNQWKVGPPKPTPANNLCNFTAVVDNDSLYMVAVGGNGPNGPLAVNEWLNLGPFQLVVGVNENNNLNIGLTGSPNPLNDFTTIKFSLDKSTRVKVSIMDVLGNELEVIADKNMNPGNIDLSWNASSYASGVYLCRVTVDGKTATQKLVKY